MSHGRTASRTGPAIKPALEQLVEAGDQIVVATQGVVGWSMNMWYLLQILASVSLVIVVVASGEQVRTPVIVAVVVYGVLMGAWFWTRKGITIAVTRRRQVLCFRTPSLMSAKGSLVARAPVETLDLAIVRRGWPFDQARYSVLGSGGGPIRVSLAIRYRAPTNLIIAAAKGSGIG